MTSQDHEPPSPDKPIDLAHMPNFALGPLVVAPSARTLSGPKGDASLEPKVMQVLVALAKTDHPTLSRDDLIELCWDGRIIGDASINRVISLLRTALRETTGDAVLVETIPKVGYRLLFEQERAGPTDAENLETGSTALQRSRNVLAIAASALVLLLGAAGYLFWPTDSQQRMSIAMLPMDPHEGTDAFYASGIASELQSELARRPGLKVTSPDSAKQMLGKDMSASDIGELLKTNGVLTGSIEAAVDRTILRMSLIESGTGDILWQGTLASSPDSAETLPARAARAMAEALGLDAAQHNQLLRIPDADFQLYLTSRGMVATRDPEQLRVAADNLAQIVERHPEFAAGWSLRAKAVALLNTSVGDQALEDAARHHAQRALELNENSVEALKIAGLIATSAEERVGNLQKAIELDPGDAEAWLWLGHVSDDPRHIGGVEQAMTRLVELDPLWDRSWQAAYYVRAMGNPEGADRLDNIVRAAAVEPWQIDMANARIASRRGDQSELIRASKAAMPVLTVGERQLIGLPLISTSVIVGVPPPAMPESGIDGVVSGALTGRMPSEAEMDALGIDGERFFALLPLIIGGMPSLIADGREAQVVRYFDEAFGTAEEFEKFAKTSLRTHHMIPQIATYAGYAMRRVGREEDATELFDLAEKSIALWRDVQPNMTSRLFEAHLSAAKGERARAIAALSDAIDLGWPYNVASPGVAGQGPLSRDAIWSQWRSDPDLNAALAPVRANIAKERAEVLALSD
ncbi:Non-specific serine/threonine protein kinase [Altererythrobacter insulae]|nr:Non-specific serine/threonine protein kinase [Altererythrobacter insulae]